MKRYLPVLVLAAALSACTYTEDKNRVNLISNDVVPTVETPHDADDCPDWTKFSGFNYYNTEHSNFGCSTVTNYGLMIEDPNDMVTGKTRDYVSGANTANAVNAYEGGAAAAPAAASAAATPSE